MDQACHVYLAYFSGVRSSPILVSLKSERRDAYLEQAEGGPRKVVNGRPRPITRGGLVGAGVVGSISLQGTKL